MKIPFALIIQVLSFGGSAIAQDYSENPTSVLDRLQKINRPHQTCVVDPKMEYACDSMSEFSCKAGTFDDGTGEVLSDAVYAEKVSPFKEKTREYYSDAIFQMLRDQDPKFNMVRDLAIQAMKQEGTPDCGAKKKSELKSCYRRVADLLAERHAKAELVISSNSPSNHETVTEFDYESFQALSSLRVYTDSTKIAHEKTMKLVTNEKRARKVEKDIFPKVKKILTAKINEMVADPEVKMKLINKIQSIAYAGSDCSEVYSSFKGTSVGLLIPNAFYNSALNAFMYCNGKLLRNNSEFSIVQIITHELSHSIDPCNIQSVMGKKFRIYEKRSSIEELESQYPFRGVLGCLHSNESIGALSRSSPVDSHRPFCEGDQIGEAFADWMGAEVLADYTEEYNASLSPNQKLIGYSNIFRDYCNMPQESGFDVHPSLRSRIDRILMANPKIRKQIGCGQPKNGLHYCKSGEDFKGTRAVYVPPPVPISAPSPLPDMGDLKTGGTSK